MIRSNTAIIADIRTIVSESRMTKHRINETSEAHVQKTAARPCLLPALRIAIAAVVDDVAAAPKHNRTKVAESNGSLPEVQIAKIVGPSVNSKTSDRQFVAVVI